LDRYLQNKGKEERKEREKNEQEGEKEIRSYTKFHLK
jgi:hypothetical protein